MTPKADKAAIFLRALLAGESVAMGGQVYQLRQGCRDVTGRASYELGMLVLPEKDLNPKFLKTQASLSEFILLSESMTEQDYDRISKREPPSPYVKRKLTL